MMASRISARFITLPPLPEKREFAEKLAKNLIGTVLPQPASLRKRYLAASAPRNATVRCAAPTWHPRGEIRQFSDAAALERHRLPRGSSRAASHPAGWAWRP